MADIVIVGAGPVGLWTALQLKRRRPDWNIKVYERHEQYQRSHVLRVDHWSMLLYGRHKGAMRDERQLALYRDITGKNLSQVALQPAASLFIRTNDLEAILRSHAMQNGISIANELVQSPEQLERRHLECSRFIAADGARSRMRAALLGPDGVRDIPLQRVIEVKYEVAGDISRFAGFSEQLRANRLLSFMAFAYVGKRIGASTPVTLRIFVDEATHLAIGEASFKQPLTLESPSVPASLRKDIETYIRLRSTDTNYVVQPSAVRLTKLTLSMYRAREFVIRRGAVAWFLVGDAAMGVPYFRALNSGLILASRLAQIVGTKNWPISGKLDRQVWFYRAHRPLRVRTEFAIAVGKNALLNGYDWMRQIAAAAPDSNIEELVTSTSEFNEREGTGRS